MLGNFAFTLYEIFGYLLPGVVGLLGFSLMYWAIFLPAVSLRIAMFQPGLATGTGMAVAAYLLGHAAQAVANRVLIGVERSARSMKSAAWLSERAGLAAAELMGNPENILEPSLVHRILDEYAVQTGHLGDRDILIYREGFYRGTCVSFFFLSGGMLLRLLVPGTSIQLNKWVLNVSRWELLLTAAITFAMGWLFLARYRRFVEHRVIRTVLAALVIRGMRNVGHVSPVA